MPTDQDRPATTEGLFGKDRQHEYGDSFTGMLCGAMVELPNDGGGDQCGKPYADPIHIKPEGWTPPEPRLSEAREKLLAVLTAHYLIRHLDMCECGWEVRGASDPELYADLFNRHLAEEIEKEITLT